MNSAISSTSSRTAASMRTRMPMPASRWASQEPLVLATSPDVISSPTVRMMAWSSALVTLRILPGGLVGPGRAATGRPRRFQRANEEERRNPPPAFLGTVLGDPFLRHSGLPQPLDQQPSSAEGGGVGFDRVRPATEVHTDVLPLH